MTSPRLQFTPMQILQMKMRELELKHIGLLATGQEEMALRVHEEMCETQNQMERLGDAAFDKAHS